MKFRTTDGYLLFLVDGRWTDGDLSFEDRGGWPVDDRGERLDGEIVENRFMGSADEITLL